MTQTLKDKVTIVTGASSGIGRAIALKFAEEGAKLILSDVDEAGGKQTLKMIEDKKGTAFFIKADCASPSDNQKLVDTALSRYGALHIAVNNAGIAGPSAPVGEYPIEGWDRVIAVNLSGVFYGMRSQIPAMLKSGGGSIINISSILGQVGFANAPAYTASKHGLIGLTKNAALEYSSKNIRVNVVGPAFIKTPMVENNISKEAQDFLIGMHPIGRFGEPSEVAELVLWLGSEKASFVTGSYYAIDGGYLAH